MRITHSLTMTGSIGKSAFEDNEDVLAMYTWANHSSLEEEPPEQEVQAPGGVDVNRSVEAALDLAWNKLTPFSSSFLDKGKKSRAVGRPPLSLLSLSNEILTLIGGFLPRRDVLSFALVSRFVNTIAVPVIYGTVDLSIHNRGRVRDRDGGGNLTHYQHSRSYRCDDVPSLALTKQEKFLDQVRQHPEYAGYVQSLCWTLLLLAEPEWHRETRIWPLLNTGRTYPLLGRDDRPILHIWEVFQSLINVKTLDLAYLSHDHSHPLASAFPNALFPSATSIRLSGVFDYALAASILAANPAKLRHLIWDNVQQPKQDRSLFRQTNLRQPYHQQRAGHWNDLTLFSGKPDFYFSWPGPMHNLLGSLIGRCTNLTSLELHNPGERGPRYTSGRSEMTPIYSALDEDIYFEWAEFIQSHKRTVQHLLWEQGPHDYRIWTSELLPLGSKLERIMDERFQRIVGPVLMNDPSSWPNLKSLSVRGFKIGDGQRSRIQEVEELLSARFGDKVRCELTEVANVLEHIGIQCHR